MKKRSKLKKIIFSTLLLIGIVGVSAPFLVSCSGEIEGLNPTAIINLIFPNIWVFVATILSAIILLSSIIWFVWKPLNKKIELRKDYINKEISDAEQAKKNAFELEQKAHDEFAKVQLRASEIIENANEKANTLFSEMQNQARVSAYEIVKGAQEEMSIQKQEMQETMHEQILDVAFAAVTHISKQKITKEENDKLVENFINDLKENK